MGVRVRVRVRHVFKMHDIVALLNSYVPPPHTFVNNSK